MTTENYVKLVGSITQSSLWTQSAETRVVWFTLLAMANSSGDVFTGLAGLARMANVPRETVDRAIKYLLAPDPDSRDPMWEGRRVEIIDGGYHILNHFKYRGTASDDWRREYQRKWIAEKRKRMAGLDRDPDMPEPEAATPPAPPTPLQLKEPTQEELGIPSELDYFKQIVNAYHEQLPDFPHVQKLSEKRVKLLRKMMQGNPECAKIDYWIEFFRFVGESDFLTGRSGIFKGCDFEWLITPDNHLLVTEGRYHDNLRVAP